MFKTIYRFCFLLLLCLPVAAHADEARPNVVLILADDMSPHLSMLATPGIQTPNIDSLAQNGVYFTKAFSASASCSPSRTAILTGMWPHSNGNWRNVHSPELHLDDVAFSRETKVRDHVGIAASVPSLPEILKAKGYFTAITQKLHLSPPWRFPFDARDPVQSQPEQFEKVITSFIKQAGEKPFFIQANVASPHRPYRAHLKNNPQQSLPDAAAIDVPPFLPDLPAVRRDMQEYYACVEIADTCVGAILNALKRSNVLQNTLIIFTSDQGMPIHHAKASAYPAGTHIPLLFNGPRVKGPRQISQAVSQVDFAPTILNYVGITIPNSMQGVSLLPLLENQEKTLQRSFVFAEHNSHGPVPAEFFPQRVVTDGDWYYILNLNPEKTQKLPADLRGVEVWGNQAHGAITEAKEDYPYQAWLLTRYGQARPVEHLYDLRTDPWGVHDLAQHPSTQDVLKRMRSVMQEWRTTTSDIKKSPTEIPPLSQEN